MKLKSLGGIVFWVLLVVGCQPTGMLAPLGAGLISDQDRSLGTYRDIEAEIQVLSSNKTRIYIYRSQQFLGMAARPAVIVNGKWLGGIVSPPNILLVPGSLIIVDSPALKNEVWLKSGNKEEADDKQIFASVAGEPIYLKYTMKPTYAYLTATNKDIAEEEVKNLKFMGHFSFSKNLKFLCKENPSNLKPDYVIIDNSKAAYTVFVGIAEERLNAVEYQIENEKDVEILTWGKFLREREKYIEQKIIMDEYPNSRAIEGILELVTKFSDSPFGLTWNGGIAVTQSDYLYAEDTFQQYNIDPARYKVEIFDEQRNEPVNPQGHFGPLLCW